MVTLQPRIYYLIINPKKTFEHYEEVCMRRMWL